MPAGQFQAILAAGQASSNPQTPGTAGNVTADAQSWGIPATLALQQVPIVDPTTAQAPNLRPHEPDAVTGQTMSVVDALNSIFLVHGDDLQTLQKNMLAAGLYGPSYEGRHPKQIDYGFVTAGDATAQAWKRLVTTAYQDPNGRAVQQVLADAMKDRAAGRAGLSAPPVPVHIDLTNPDDLVKAFQDEAVRKVGHQLTDAQLQSMISVFQGVRAQSQTASADAQANQTGGTSVATPDPTAFVDSQLNQTMGPQVGAHDIASQFSNFVSILKGGMT